MEWAPGPPSRTEVLQSASEIFHSRSFSVPHGQRATDNRPPTRAAIPVFVLADFHIGYFPDELEFTSSIVV
jgi:hypothetical protein